MQQCQAGGSVALGRRRAQRRDTVRLAELVDDKNELIAESGIKTRQDVEKLIRVGVGGVLIGQTLCESPRIDDKFNELFNPDER